ncbi:Hypothetical predicted protein [Podarcis lilfordi]|uniref:Uncharacterized protein n=1 Tax=Podarcis lilfordi TaxID=74358 RepID=A0AA35KCM7_9SAUR|nr:Hypothetical predicted protein [Podarcis lilfordi]
MLSCALIHSSSFNQVVKLGGLGRGGVSLKKEAFWIFPQAALLGKSPFSEINLTYPAESEPTGCGSTILTLGHHVLGSFHLGLNAASWELHALEATLLYCKSPSASF